MLTCYIRWTVDNSVQYHSRSHSDVHWDQPVLCTEHTFMRILSAPAAVEIAFTYTAMIPSHGLSSFEELNAEIQNTGA